MNTVMTNNAFTSLHTVSDRKLEASGKHIRHGLNILVKATSFSQLSALQTSIQQKNTWSSPIYSFLTLSQSSTPLTVHLIF